jgi:hypothetical protein
MWALTGFLRRDGVALPFRYETGLAGRRTVRRLFP